MTVVLLLQVSVCFLRGIAAVTAIAIVVVVAAAGCYYKHHKVKLTRLAINCTRFEII